MLFTSVNFGSVNTTPRSQGRGDRSLIARSGTKSFVYSRMGVLRSNEGRSTRVHEYTSTRVDSQPMYFGPFMILPFTPSLASNPPLMRLFIAVLELFGVFGPKF